MISYADYMTLEWHQIEKGHRHQRPQIEKVNGATRKLCQNLGSTPKIVSRLDKPLTDLLLKFKDASWHGFASAGKLQLCEPQGNVASIFVNFFHKLFAEEYGKCHKLILPGHGLNSWLAPCMEHSANLGDLSWGIRVTLTRSSLTGSIVKSCSVPGTKKFVTLGTEVDLHIGWCYSSFNISLWTFGSDCLYLARQHWICP